MIEIKELKQSISQLKKFNDNYASNSSSSELEVREDSTLLNRSERELLRIEKAMEIPSAIGVFGQSQCGKSYLVSELTGGRESKVLITGVEGKDFQDYNQMESDQETTAVVTRFTQQVSATVPPRSVMVSFMSPSEVMWSITYGFYGELRSTGFELDEEKKKEIREQILSPDNASHHIPHFDQVTREFSECINWLKEYFSLELELANIAIDHLNSGQVHNISLERFVLIASTLWNNDETITDCFRARIEALDFYGYPSAGYLPEELLKDVLIASNREKLSLRFDRDSVYSFEGESIIAPNSDDNKISKLNNLQAVIKEVVLPIEENDNSVLSKLDVLDFPGARAPRKAGIAAHTSEDIQNDLEDGNSEILAGLYKRGKLLYLFDLYCNRFDITLLLFCSQHGTQEAHVMRTMLSNWIDRNVQVGGDIGAAPRETALFVALTMSDKMIKKDDKRDRANIRLTGRFRANFANIYGNWVDNFGEKGEPFKNFYFTRNPQATLQCFDKDSQTGTEVWRPGFEESKDIFQSAYKTNAEVEHYLGDRKQELFDQVFIPGKTGIDYLRKNIINRHDQDPDLKEKVLRKALYNIVSQLTNYRDKYYQGDSNAQVEENQRKQAREFVEVLEKRPESVSVLLNGIMKMCPGEKYLYDIVKKKIEPDTGVDIIPNTTPMRDSVIKFFSKWIDTSAGNKALNKKLEVPEGQLNQYFDCMKSYLASESVIENDLKNIDSFFKPVPADTRSLRNYALWIVGRRIYYLGYIEQDGIPTGPVPISGDENFTAEVLGIWRDRLPEIYVGNFTIRAPQDGIDLLTNLNFPKL